MSALRQRALAAVAAALTFGSLACSEKPRDAIDSVGDTMTTPTMRRELTDDLRAAELALRAVEDSVDAALGPEIAMRLQPMREAFVTYRREQCARLKAVFKEGTFGPVAELECLVHLTDSRIQFVEEHYDFIERLGKRTSGIRKAIKDHEAIRKR